WWARAGARGRGRAPAPRAPGGGPAAPAPWAPHTKPSLDPFVVGLMGVALGVPPLHVYERHVVAAGASVSSTPLLVPPVAVHVSLMQSPFSSFGASVVSGECGTFPFASQPWPFPAVAGSAGSVCVSAS